MSEGFFPEYHGFSKFLHSQGVDVLVAFLSDGGNFIRDRYSATVPGQTLNLNIKLRDPGTGRDPRKRDGSGDRVLRPVDETTDHVLL